MLVRVWLGYVGSWGLAEVQAIIRLMSIRSRGSLSWILCRFFRFATSPISLWSFCIVVGYWQYDCAENFPPNKYSVRNRLAGVDKLLAKVYAVLRRWPGRPKDSVFGGAVAHAVYAFRSREMSRLSIERHNGHLK